MLNFYSYPDSTSPLYFVFIVLRTLFNEAVPLFLLLSGFLQANKTFGKKHYMGLIPLFITYALSVATAYVTHVLYYGDAIGFSKFIYSIFSFQINSYSWYFEMFIGLYLLMPFLNLMYKSIPDIKQKFVLVLILLLCTSVPVSIAAFPAFGDRLLLVPSYWKIMYPISCYILGSFIREVSPKINKLILFACLAVSVLGVSGMQFISSFGEERFNMYVFANEGDLATVVIATLIFLLLYDLDIKNRFISGFFKGVSLASFDIYMFSYTVDLLVYETALKLGFHELVFFPILSLVVLCLSFIISLVKRGAFNLFGKLYAKSGKPLYKVCVCVIVAVAILASLYLVEADDNKALYIAANEDCFLAETDEYAALACVTHDSPHATWDENKERVLVLIAHEGDDEQFSGEKRVIFNDRMYFCVLPIEMKEWFNAEGIYAQEFDLRLRQILGLNPNSEFNSISAVWVYPEDLVRTTHDSDISRQPVGYTNAEPPEHKENMDTLRIQADIDSMLFTGLGYTYDWFENGRDYGLTLFGTLRGTKAEIVNTWSFGSYRDELMKTDKSETW